MYDKLENLLNQWLSVERRESILNALEVLESYNAMSAWSEISAMLEYSTDDSLDMIIDGIETVLRVGLEKTIAAHSITVNATIPVMTKILESIKTMSNFEDSESILKLTENSNNSIETFMDLFELVTTIPWAQIADSLVAVSPAFIQAVHAIYAPKDEDMEEMGVSQEDANKARRLHQYMLQHPNCLAKVALVDECRPLNVPMAILLNDYKLDLGRYEPRAAKQAAEELVGLALLGDVPFNDFVKGVKQLTDTVYTDLNFITQVDVAIDNYFAEISKNEQASVPH